MTQITETDTDCYKTNLELLKIHHPVTWERITQGSHKALGRIIHSPGGQPNLVVTDTSGNPVTLHNKENPEKESMDFMEKIPENHKGFVAILGLGLCSCALNIFNQRPHLQRLALFELEPGFFIQALKHIDLSSILTDPRLILAIGPQDNLSETLAPASRTMQLEDSSILHHLPSFEFNPKGYNRLKDDLFKHINSLNVGGTTTRLLGKDFVNNRFKHITTIHHHLLLESIKDRFKNVPAILVAGGPSLDKNIHLLKHAREKAVIIAVDTVLPALLKNNVQPHFLTCIDPNNLTFEKFADVIPSVKDIALICSSWVNTKTPKIFPADQIFWTFTGKPMEAWLNSLVGGKVLTGGASTVAHLNFIAAHMLDCNPIIFVGQDLAYPNTSSTSHASGTILQGTAPKNKISNQQGETVTGINGETLRTNRSFLSMKSFFESAIAGSNKIHINATEGGADIEGTKILSLQKALDKHCKTRPKALGQLKKFYSETIPVNPGPMLAEFNKLMNKIKKLRKLIKQSDNIAGSVLKDILKFKKRKTHIKSFTMLPLHLQKQINKLDKLHKDLDGTKKIWEISEEITMDGLKESERQKQDIAILKNDPDQYLDWLATNLNRLTDINRVRTETLDILSTNLNMVAAFHKNETKYQKQDKLKLAKLYIESENYCLAAPLLEKLHSDNPESGEIHFYLGCIAAQSNMLKKADMHFQTAARLDPGLDNKIKEFKQKIADSFLSFARYFKNQPGREPSVKHMVEKGLKYDPDHTELKQEQKIILKKELKAIQANLDALFAAGDFNRAIQALNEAVKKDIKFAAYWETRGDTLQSAGQHQDAILAYERCFTSLPDRIHLLKKIGDCYMATDQLEAAKAAYQQLKLKMKNSCTD